MLIFDSPQRLIKNVNKFLNRKYKRKVNLVWIVAYVIYDLQLKHFSHF